MNRWKEIGSNADTKLWEAPLPSGNGAVRVCSATQPPDWMGFSRRPFEGHTADDARIAAAEDLVIEDSTIDPIPGSPFT